MASKGLSGNVAATQRAQADRMARAKRKALSPTGRKGSGVRATTYDQQVDSCWKWLNRTLREEAAALRAASRKRIEPPKRTKDMDFDDCQALVGVSCVIEPVGTVVFPPDVPKYKPQSKTGGGKKGDRRDKQRRTYLRGRRNAAAYREYRQAIQRDEANKEAIREAIRAGRKAVAVKTPVSLALTQTLSPKETQAMQSNTTQTTTTQKVKAYGPRWSVVGLKEWQNQSFSATARERLSAASLGKEATMSFNGRNTEPMSVTRFLELTTISPKTTYGWDEEAQQYVNTGLYQPYLATQLDGIRVQQIRFPAFRSAFDKELFGCALHEFLERTGAVQLTRVSDTGVTIMQRCMVIPYEEKRIVRLNQAGFGSVLAEAGLRFEKGEKGEKRNFLTGNMYGYQFTIARDEIEIDLWGQADDDEATSNDGVGQISPAVRERLAYSIGPDAASTPEGKRHVKRCLHAQAFYFRGTLEEGLLKGLFVVNEVLTGLKIVSHRKNLKLDGPRCTKEQVVICVDPTEGKDYARLHVQAWLTHQWLFGPKVANVMSWIYTDVKNVYESIVSGTMDSVLDGVIEEATAHLTGNKAQQEEQREQLLQTMKWAALEWRDCGMKLQNSWGLSEFIFQGHSAFLRDWSKGNMNPKIPCSLYCLVFAESFALDAGIIDRETWTAPIPDGAIRICGYGTKGKLKCAVVSEATYANMCGVHGGADGDDFFMLIFRMIEGVKKVIVLRTPCGPQEYSILDYTEGDFNPVSHLWQWKEATKTDMLHENVSFPPVRGVPPQRIDEALECGAVEILQALEGGLPDATPREVSKYSIEYTLESIDRAMSNVGIGSAANLFMFGAQAHDGKSPSLMLATMEKMVDACMQGGSENQFWAIRNWVAMRWLMLSDEVREAYERDGTCLVDAWLWNKRAPQSQTSNRQKTPLFRFPLKEAMSSPFKKLMDQCEWCLEYFGSKSEQNPGKLQQWLAEEGYECHTVFDTIAQSVERTKPGEILKQEAVLKQYRKDAKAIYDAHPVTQECETWEGKRAHKDKIRAAFKALDIRLEMYLLKRGVKERHAAFMCAVYRNGDGKYRDSMCFCTDDLRAATFAVIRAFTQSAS